MKKAILLLLTFTLSLSIFAGEKKIEISTSADAKIFVNGKDVASGSFTIEVKKDATVKVKVVKMGYITMERTYSNDNVSKLPKSDFYDLVKDPAYDASSGANIANKDIDITSSKSDDEAWKLLCQIVTSTFDVIEVTDKNTSYLRTAWSLKRFGAGSTIRTRLIVKMGSSNPTVYKIKIVSEYAPAGTSPNDDEKWQEWDRLLKIYEDMIPELQSRLK